MGNDRNLFVHHPPVWWLPSIAIVRSGIKRRLSLFIWLHTDLVPYVSHDDTFTWWLQVRAWWPPVYFYRGWVRWD